MNSFNGDTRLSKKARKAIENLNNNTFVSVASYWEIGIKISLGKLYIEKGFHFINLRTETSDFILLQDE